MSKIYGVILIIICQVGWFFYLKPKLEQAQTASELKPAGSTVYLLLEPVVINLGDEGGGRDDDKATVFLVVLEPEGSGDGQADDGQLAEFDADVEAEQGADDGAFRDTFIDEALSEA